MQRGVALFKFAAPILIIFLSACAWNVKTIKGKDVLNLSHTRVKESGFISDRRPEPLKLDDELTTGVTLGTEELLRQKLVVGKTSLPEIINLLGEPIQVAFGPTEIKLSYSYLARWKKGYYRVSLRKINREFRFGYELEVTLSKSEDQAPDFIVNGFSLRFDLEPQYLDDWDPLNLGRQWFRGGEMVTKEIPKVAGAAAK